MIRWLGRTQAARLAGEHFITGSQAPSAVAQTATERTLMQLPFSGILGKKLSKTILLQLEQDQVQNPTWKVEKLIQQFFLLLIQDEDNHSTLNLRVQKQPKNIQHTTAARNCLSTSSANASPSAKRIKCSNFRNTHQNEPKQL